jgi:hypothetical protein
MITQRFRPVGWVASVAAAATILYLISLQVATERGRLEEIDTKIASTTREIRQLQTELGTRASLRQLERWNSEVLALSAPGAGQFLNNEAALASVDQSSIGKQTATTPMVAVMATQTSQDANAAAPAPTLVAKIASVAMASPPVKLTKQDRAIQKAMDMPKREGNRVALVDASLLDRSALEKAAKGEARSQQKARP